MKMVLGLFFLVLFTVECNQRQQESNWVQEDLVITYEANTRGFYEKTWVTKDSVSFSSDRDLEVIVVSKCKKEDWDVLVSLLNGVELKSLAQLEPPTKMHQYDGAAMATLTVKVDHQTYETGIFDHGHPPKTISALVNKVLSIKEMMAKQ